MKFKSLSSQEYLHSILDCNPNTGIFIWKWRGDIASYINSRLMGSVAGTPNNGYVQIKFNGKFYGEFARAS